MTDHQKRTGESFSTLTDICPECKGEGTIFYRDEEDRPYEKPCPVCEGGKAKQIETAKKLSNIPLKYSEREYSSFDWNIYRDETGKLIDTTKIKDVTEDFLRAFREWQEEGMGLYIYSKTKGSGKTLLASCICNELMDRYKIRTKFVNASQLINLDKSKNSESDDEYKRDPIKYLCNCELLVLDDIGQTQNGYQDSLSYDIVNSRYEKQLITVYTSNLSFGDLSTDERTVQRIASTSFPLKLPEYNVRVRESNDKMLSFLKERGLLRRE